MSSWSWLKDGLGPRPAAQTAKRYFLNRLKTSSKPWLDLRSALRSKPWLSCTAPVHAEVQGPCRRAKTTWQWRSPRSVAQTAKRYFLNRLETSSKPWLYRLYRIETSSNYFLNELETSSKPWLYLRSCTANCQLACVVWQLAFVRRGSAQGTPSQGSNTMACVVCPKFSLRPFLHLVASKASSDALPLLAAGVGGFVVSNVPTTHILEINIPYAIGFHWDCSRGMLGRCWC